MVNANLITQLFKNLTVKKICIKILNLEVSLISENSLVQLKFPKNFLWGTATSAYQIEGAYQDDDKGLSIWDVFCQEPGKIFNGDTGNIACDHYHRYKNDLALIKELGVNAYRFSISWPRILPKGQGKINTIGIKFYDNLIDQLNEAGIQPWVTLYHWDLPQELQNKGGWESPMIIDAFEEYTKLVGESFKDKVAGWYILNEPFVSSFLGNAWGTHAPGKKSYEIALKVAHHHLMAQGKAIIALRDILPKNIPVGTVVNVSNEVTQPSTPNKEKFLSKLKDLTRYWLLDPIYFGKYPDTDYKLPFKVNESDFELIKQKIDILGINYYARSIWIPDENTEYFKGKTIPEASYVTEKKWKIHPYGLFQTIRELSERYGKIPMQITENGAAFEDIWKQGNPEIIQDDDRIVYIRDHLAEVLRAIKNGYNVTGYFYWSLLDNFEWADGYSMKFGIVEVDQKTLKRNPKKSFYYYKDIVKKNSLIYP